MKLLDIDKITILKCIGGQNEDYLSSYASHIVSLDYVEWSNLKGLIYLAYMRVQPRHNTYLFGALS